VVNTKATFLKVRERPDPIKEVFSSLPVSGFFFFFFCEFDGMHIMLMKKLYARKRVEVLPSAPTVKDSNLERDIYI